MLAATDHGTDLGKILVDNHFGFWAESGNLKEFIKIVDQIAHNPGLLPQMGDNGYNYLKNNYLVSRSYNIIMNHFHSGSNAN